MCERDITEVLHGIYPKTLWRFSVIPALLAIEYCGYGWVHESERYPMARQFGIYLHSIECWRMILLPFMGVQHDHYTHVLIGVR